MIEAEILLRKLARIAAQFGAHGRRRQQPLNRRSKSRFVSRRNKRSATFIDEFHIPAHAVGHDR